ncbi:PREDICTED: uncharacterized protein LOC104825537 [Tarenaya hassleriana]|uniref:uncharacterized protein LOC104808433 n=1 Tax=Tarenaya hassleriana TaxID=28532 RepID=UPI00053C1332|nr:PREDICTED: uncharacterized protein LOC104808433 [Tarenaya hassleriana]XP_010556187.1 PREDICTED: uncharacterized protein LOC104825537 [Tarenaya hassleriana]
MAPKTVVFIETNLGTYLVTFFRIRETVFSFKNRLVKEHQLCFPDVGEIEISALKVKHGGRSYHLSDTVFLMKALEEVRPWGGSHSAFLEIKRVVKKGNENLQSFSIPPGDKDGADKPSFVHGGKGSSPFRRVRATVSLLASLPRGCSHF